MGQRALGKEHPLPDGRMVIRNDQPHPLKPPLQQPLQQVAPRLLPLPNRRTASRPWAIRETASLPMRTRKSPSVMAATLRVETPCGYISRTASSTSPAIRW